MTRSRCAASCLAVLTAFAAARAQAPEGFRLPPEPSAGLAVAPPPPQSSLSPQRTWLVLTATEAMPRLDVVARPKFGLAGLRLDAATGGPQLGARTMGMTLQNLATGAELHVAVPEGH